MTRNLSFVLALSFFLAACQGRQEVTTVDAVYSSELANALQQQEISNKKRAMLVFDSGATAQTCDEYLRLLAGAALKEEVNNQLAKGDYLLCEVLAMVGDKKLGAGPRSVTFGTALANRLDLRSFPSSLFQMLDKQKHSLSQLDAKAIKVDSTTVTYETEDWHFRLELVATLDVNNNGKADWVLWLADEAKSGNYRQYQTLVVYDVSDTGPMHAAPYTVKMNAQRGHVAERTTMKSIAPAYV